MNEKWISLLQTQHYSIPQLIQQIIDDRIETKGYEQYCYQQRSTNWNFGTYFETMQQQIQEIINIELQECNSLLEILQQHVQQNVPMQHFTSFDSTNTNHILEIKFKDSSYNVNTYFECYYKSRLQLFAFDFCFDLFQPKITTVKLENEFETQFYKTRWKKYTNSGPILWINNFIQAIQTKKESTCLPLCHSFCNTIHEYICLYSHEEEKRTDVSFVMNMMDQLLTCIELFDNTVTPILQLQFHAWEFILETNLCTLAKQLSWRMKKAGFKKKRNKNLFKNQILPIQSIFSQIYKPISQSVVVEFWIREFLNPFLNMIEMNQHVKPAIQRICTLKVWKYFVIAYSLDLFQNHFHLSILQPTHNTTKRITVKNQYLSDLQFAVTNCTNKWIPMNSILSWIEHHMTPFLTLLQ